MNDYLKMLASLKVTVALFGMSIFLVFAGTLAQVDNGIWHVMDSYFRCFITWIDLGVFFPRKWDISFTFPFLGGWALGLLLMLNLTAAHITTFKYNKKRIGIILIHAGIAIMLLSEFFTGLAAVESRMVIKEGSWSNYTQSNRLYELAIKNPKTKELVSVPVSMLADSSEVTDEQLPFDLKVKEFYENAALMPVVKGQHNLATAGSGLALYAVEKPVTTGVDTEQSVNAPSVYVQIGDKTYLVSLYLKEQLLDYKGTEYEVSLRLKRYYKPYKMTLEDFSHDKFVGTEIPRNFSSKILLENSETGEKRNVLIYMNNPLRYNGETFYQSGFLPDNSGTILQVVYNPVWLWPYISCAVVSLGMMWHFGLGLYKFTKRKTNEVKV